ncbi:hypothetical protein [Methylobacterium radiodurans]|uniref:Uncharacterized protein n=1 Tax=Methylobacterium radiodurans TaxID=2202828 RepID=A0A2U8VWH4_9HYPH|nr:hypothetical protein [Methylobacterium radiodurans]AWN38177.1 hypothetical protein DK427_22575 [Methylobacterium radiodurans]
MRKLQSDIDALPLGPDPVALADPDTLAALRRLAEICIEAHGIVAREGPAEIREPLEALLGRIGHQLSGDAASEETGTGR